MNLQSRRGSEVIRQVLKEVILEDSNIPSRGEEVERTKLKEVVHFLEKKIDRQHAEIKVISDQLSREISIKEQLLVSLNDEKEKSFKLSQNLSIANRALAELRRKTARVPQQQQQKQDFEVKLNRYREIVRKKDELLLKNQQKVDELLKNQKHANKLDHDLKCLRDSFGRLKARQQNLASENEKLKQKCSQAVQKAQQTGQKLRESQQSCLYLEQQLRRSKTQFADLQRDLQEDQRKFQIMKQTKQKQQNTLRLEVSRLQQLTQRKPQIIPPEALRWDLDVFKREAKRILDACLKDVSTRKRIEKDFLQLLTEVQQSFGNILTKILGQQ